MAEEMVCTASTVSDPSITALSRAAQMIVNDKLAINILCIGDQLPLGHLPAIPERV